MTLLSEKPDHEISQLLDQYGIKHGPIVGSTRKLYEKKLSEAMGFKRPSPDKTYYREEEEEVEYITYRPPPPTRHDAAKDVTRRSKFTDLPQDVRRPQLSSELRDLDSSTRQKLRQTSSGVPGWIRVLLFLLILLFLCFVYTCMEPEEQTPFHEIH